MWYKQAYLLRNMGVGFRPLLPATWTEPAGKGETLLDYRTLDKQELLCCDAIIEKATTPKIEEVLNGLNNGVLPASVLKSLKLPYLEGGVVVVGVNGEIKPGRWLRLELFPQWFRDFHEETQEIVSELATRFVKTLRWVQSAAGPQTPFGSLGFHWSVDKVDWKPMPRDLRVSVEMPRMITVDSAALAEITEVWKGDDREPVAHELIREALDVCQMNPRSALLIAISSLETGVKSYIHHLVQHSDIILEKIPSPPVITLCQEVIPDLHKALGTNSTAFPLSDDDKKLVQKWIGLRNRIAHGSTQRLDSLKLKEFLKFVRALLYKIDENRGFLWAREFTTAA